MKAKTEFSAEYPRTLFHANGVATTIAVDDVEHAKLSVQGWFDEPQPPPPPAQEPLTAEEQAAVTASEIEGLGDQVDSQATLISAVETKVQKLQELCQQLVRTVTQLEARMSAVEKRKAV